MCPAVPRTSGVGHARAAVTAAADLAELRVASSVRQSSRSVPSRTMPTTGGSPVAEPRGQLLERAREALDLGQRERAAADAARGLLDLAAGQRGEALRPLADVAGGLGEHPQHRDLAQRPLRVAVERERALERRERELVGPQRALERVAAQALDEVGPAGDDARLRPAEQLVAREADEVCARGEALACGRLVLEAPEDARAEVVDEREPVPVRRARPARRAPAAP